MGVETANRSDNMKVYAAWYGGGSYAAPDWNFLESDDTEVKRTNAGAEHSHFGLEEFSSIQDAKDAFYSRSDFEPGYPCVENSSMMLFAPKSWERGGGNNFPFAELTLGPRGGVRVSIC
jgi:hypothetical protein